MVRRRWIGVAVALWCSWLSVPSWAAPFAYVTNADFGTVSVIDTDINAVVETIPVAMQVVGVAVNPGGTRVYVTDRANGRVHVIDAFTNTVLTSVVIGSFPNNSPEAAVLSPTQPLLYVLGGSSQIAVMNTTSNTMSAPIPITPGSPGDAMQAIAINPAGTRLYSTQVFSQMLNVVDTTTNMEIATVPLAGDRGVIVHPSGTPVYVANNNVVNMIDATTNTISGSIALGAGCFSAFGLAVNAAGTRLFVTCGNSAALAIVDLNTNMLVTTVPVGFVPLGISLTPDEAFAYTANAGDNTVSAVDLSTNMVVATVPVDDEPHAFGNFIGPDFTCGDGNHDPGEGCDDGNNVNGDGCTADCKVPRDAVVLAGKPLTVKLGEGKAATTKTLKVTVRNADTLPDPEGARQTIQLDADTTNCPALTGYVSTPDFGAGTNQVSLAGGERGKAKVQVTVAAGQFTTFNKKAPTRCWLTFRAKSAPSIGVAEVTPSNNAMTVDVNVIDANDPEMNNVHESTILSPKPFKLKINAGDPSTTKSFKLKVSNADYLPTAEAAAAHSMSVSALDGDCPLLTVGTVTFDGSPTVQVEGGKSAKGTLPITVSAVPLSSPSALSPARCTATLSVAGPAGDSDASNNSTRLIIDVSDENDF